MRIINLGALLLLFTGSLHAMDQIAHRGPPPDAGISDDELEKLGPSVDSELIRRFDGTNGEKFRRGLLFRMRLYGDLKKPNAKVFSVLKGYIESEASTCKGEVSLQRIFNIGDALQVAGQRGGSLAVDYLRTWIEDKSVYGRIHCFNHARSEEDVQEQLRRSAIAGLGYSGDKSGLDFLRALANNPPKVKYSGSLLDAVNSAILRFESIQKHGIEKHFQSSRENIKTYRDGKNAEDGKRK